MEIKRRDLMVAGLGAAYAFHLFFDAKVADEMQKELHRGYGQNRCGLPGRQIHS
ncbi:MAG: hypothetical protein KJO34_09540 [Deltaproteobacteria bacterium]|nr:hypothetical protein [Deltaproteobacteria bacterium]